MRREGLSPEDIAAAVDMPLDEVEKVLVQMRTPRPETRPSSRSARHPDVPA
jgi:hypothetical protein